MKEGMSVPPMHVPLTELSTTMAMAKTLAMPGMLPPPGMGASTARKTGCPLPLSTGPREMDCSPDNHSCRAQAARAGGRAPPEVPVGDLWSSVGGAPPVERLSLSGLPRPLRWMKSWTAAETARAASL